MAAPQANQHTLVNKGGRPREHDRDAIALDLIEWAKLPSSTNLNGFCCSRDPPIAPSKITEWARADDGFRLAYESAKAFLANRREEMLSLELLHVKAYDLNAKTYDFFLNEQAQKTAEFESSLRKSEDANNNKLPITVNVQSNLGSGINVPASPLPNTDNNGP